MSELRRTLAPRGGVVAADGDEDEEEGGVEGEEEGGLHGVGGGSGGDAWRGRKEHGRRLTRG